MVVPYICTVHTTQRLKQTRDSRKPDHHTRGRGAAARRPLFFTLYITFDSGGPFFTLQGGRFNIADSYGTGTVYRTGSAVGQKSYEQPDGDCGPDGILYGSPRFVYCMDLLLDLKLLSNWRHSHPYEPNTDANPAPGPLAGSLSTSDRRSPFLVDTALKRPYIPKSTKWAGSHTQIGRKKSAFFSNKPEKSR